MRFSMERFDSPDSCFSGFDREVLVDKLTEIARDGFGSRMERGDVESHVMSVDALYLLNSGDEVVGFSSYDFLDSDDKRVLYLSGIVVKREFQKNGLFYKTQSEVISSDCFDYFTMRTQNPVMYAATQKLVKKIYPNNEIIPDEIRQVARMVASNHLGMERFCDDSFVGRVTYGKCLYDQVPSHERADDFFNKELGLNFSKGDSVILIGEL